MSDNPFTKELGYLVSVKGAILDTVRDSTKDASGIALDLLGRVPTEGELQELQVILNQLVREGRVTESGEPHYRLIPARYFVVGDVVHYSVNGDSYPGKVQLVNPSGSRVSVAGNSGSYKVFSRRRNGSYRSVHDAVWILSHGYLNERDPSF